MWCNFHSDQRCFFFFFNMSRFPVLLQFHIKAKCATHHRHGL